MDYTPHTDRERSLMMGVVGVASIDELFADIPPGCRINGDLRLPPPLSEQELAALMEGIAAENRLPRLCLLGAGAYHHYIPAVVRHVVARSEFYTAYTPYQAEISQGILQAIYEYQTMVARLTGTDVANASMYDGASSLAEGAVLAAKTLNRSRIVVGRAVHPRYRRVVATYAWANGYETVEIPYDDTGRTDPSALGEALNPETAAVLIQSPNFFGVIEDLEALAPPVHEAGALLISSFTEATSLGLLKPPGQAGADIVTGEGQAFGNPIGFGGPHLGIFAAKSRFLRKIPGRLAGATVDREGRRGFVLTLQTREQHIRRERATSNICSNEALCALAAAVYLACLGKNLWRLAEINLHKARYLRDLLVGLPGWEGLFPAPFYNEFALRCPDPAGANALLEEEGIVGGYILEDDYPELRGGILLCVTETATRQDLDTAVSILKKL